MQGPSELVSLLFSLSEFLAPKKGSRQVLLVVYWRVSLSPVLAFLLNIPVVAQEAHMGTPKRNHSGMTCGGHVGGRQIPEKEGSHYQKLQGLPWPGGSAGWSIGSNTTTAHTRRL